MGMDIHIRVTKYNEKTNLYEEIVLYKKGVEYHYDNEGNKIIDNPEFERVRIDVGRDYEMFNGMKEGSDADDYGEFPYRLIVLNSLEPELRKEIEDYMKADGFFDFWELTLADMKNYLYENPLVTDYEAWDENYDEKIKPLKTNPIQHVYDDIYNYIAIADSWEFKWNNLSTYKVLIYFDW